MWSLGCRQGESALSLLEEEHRAWVAVAPPPWQEEVSWGPTPCQLSAPALSSPPCKRKLFLHSSEDRDSPTLQPGTAEHWGHTNSSLRRHDPLLQLASIKTISHGQTLQAQP